jgi:hypothetical protein
MLRCSFRKKAFHLVARRRLRLEDSRWWIPAFTSQSILRTCFSEECRLALFSRTLRGRHRLSLFFCHSQCNDFDTPRQGDGDDDGEADQRYGFVDVPVQRSCSVVGAVTENDKDVVAANPKRAQPVAEKDEVPSIGGAVNKEPLRKRLRW